MTPPEKSSLSGFRIGVTSDRRSEDLISAFERRGAEVLHAPALRIAPNDQDEVLISETRALIAARPDLLLVTTGYGVRRWLEVAEGAGLKAELTAVLEEGSVMVRGPKALGAIRAAGLDAGLSAEETTASLVDTMLAQGWTGGTVAIQLHGYTDEVQLQRLRDVASRVLTLTPYRWAEPSSDEKLPQLIHAVCTRQLDAVTFTSAPAVDATLATARTLGRYDAFVDALRRDVVVAAVGPVTASPLLDAGLDPIVPDRHRMGALIRLVCEHLDAHRVVLCRDDRPGVWFLPAST